MSMMLVTLGLAGYTPPQGVSVTKINPDKDPTKLPPPPKPGRNAQRIRERIMRKRSVRRTVEDAPGDGWVTVKYVSDKTGISNQVSRIMLHELTKEGALEVRTCGFKTKSFEYRARIE